MSSTPAGINASSPTKIVLTAGGAGITISGGNITLKAGMKSFTGAGRVSASVSLKDPSKLYGEQFQRTDELTGQLLAGEPYRIVTTAGTVVAEGVTDASGSTRATRV